MPSTIIFVFLIINKSLLKEKTRGEYKLEKPSHTCKHTFDVLIDIDSSLVEQFYITNKIDKLVNKCDRCVTKDIE